MNVHIKQKIVRQSGFKVSLSSGCKSFSLRSSHLTEKRLQDTMWQLIMRQICSRRQKISIIRRIQLKCLEVDAMRNLSATSSSTRDWVKTDCRLYLKEVARSTGWTNLNCHSRINPETTTKSRENFGEQKQLNLCDFHLVASKKLN